MKPLPIESVFSKPAHRKCEQLTHSFTGDEKCPGHEEQIHANQADGELGQRSVVLNKTPTAQTSAASHSLTGEEMGKFPQFRARYPYHFPGIKPSIGSHLRI